MSLAVFGSSKFRAEINRRRPAHVNAVASGCGPGRRPAAAELRAGWFGYGGSRELLGEGGGRMLAALLRRRT